jgi:hypothetical protein
VLKNIHAQNNVKAPVDIQGEKITKDHGFADIGVSEYESEMAHLCSEDADARIEKT